VRKQADVARRSDHRRDACKTRSLRSCDEQGVLRGRSAPSRPTGSQLGRGRRTHNSCNCAGPCRVADDYLPRVAATKGRRPPPAQSPVLPKTPGEGCQSGPRPPGNAYPHDFSVLNGRRMVEERENLLDNLALMHLIAII
jgi:hypothetical protein